MTTTSQDYLASYRQRLQEQLDQRNAKHREAASYQLDLLEKSAAHNQIAEARRKASLVVGAPKLPGAKKLKEMLSLWMDRLPERELNRKWRWAEIKSLFDSPNDLVLAGVLKAFGWYQVHTQKDVDYETRLDTFWCPPTMPWNGKRFSESALKDYLAGLPKEPVKIQTIRQQFDGKLRGATPRTGDVVSVLESLGWFPWRDNKGHRWWLSPDTPIPIYPKSLKGGRPQVIEKKPPRPRGRPRKNPLPEHSQ
jgi:hypothetical protein